MTQENRATIKGYFETGDTPTETQFSEFVDSIPIFLDDIETGITAHAGGGQVGGYPISKIISTVSTVGSANDSLLLPVGFSPRFGIVYNHGGTIMSVYPPVGGEINQLGVNNPTTILNNRAEFFVNYDVGKWFTVV